VDQVELMALEKTMVKEGEVVDVPMPQETKGMQQHLGTTEQDQ
jgi:hypothetical protein